MTGMTGMGVPLPPPGAMPGPPPPPDPNAPPLGPDPAMGGVGSGMDPGLQGGVDPGFQSVDPTSIAHFIASMFRQMRDADHQKLDDQQNAAMAQADPLIQQMIGGMGGGGPVPGAPLDPMLGFGAGAGGPVDPNAQMGPQ